MSFYIISDAAKIEDRRIMPERGEWAYILPSHLHNANNSLVVELLPFCWTDFTDTSNTAIYNAL